MGKIYISIGISCTISLYLRNIRKRHFSLPFDWVMTYNGVYNIISSNFVNYLPNKNGTKLLNKSSHSLFLHNTFLVQPSGISSPKLEPALIPDTTMSGSLSSKPVTPKWTQSVGVPSTRYQFEATFDALMGVCKVNELLAALRSKCGATTVISAILANSSAKYLIPGA